MDRKQETNADKLLEKNGQHAEDANYDKAFRHLVTEAVFSIAGENDDSFIYKIIYNDMGDIINNVSDEDLTKLAHACAYYINNTDRQKELKKIMCERTNNESDYEGWEDLVDYDKYGEGAYYCIVEIEEIIKRYYKD